MADPTAVVNHTYKNELSRDTVSAVVTTAETLYNGGIAGMDRSTGKMDHFDDAANMIPAGLVKGPLFGVYPMLGDATLEAVAKGGVTPRVSVTGASAITDFSKLVFATDGSTFTLTRPADDAVPVGIVAKWDTSTYCWVYMFSWVESVMLGMATAGQGLGKQNLFLGSVTSGTMEGTGAIDIITEMPMYGHFSIDSFFAVTKGYDAGITAGSQQLNLEIAAADVTGGVITLTEALCDAAGDAGTVTAGTAITGTNEVHDGDVLSIEMATGGTGFTADQVGVFDLWITITPLPGA